MGSDVFEIRKAILGDVDRLVDLWIENMDFHKKLDQHYKRAPNAHESFRVFIFEHLANKNGFVFVASKMSSVVGFCCGEIALHPANLASTQYGAIYDLVVTKKIRRQGLGRKLYQEALWWFKDKKIDRIEIKVATTNTAAVNFWNKSGLKPYSMTMYGTM